MNKVIIKAGDRYGRLIFVKETKQPCGQVGKHRCGLFKCDCGRSVETRLNTVRIGHTRSCGCLHTEAVAKIGKDNKLPVGQASKNALYGRYKRDAEKRKLCFNLTIKQFEYLTKLNCHYCGQLPAAKYQNKYCNGPYIYNGIDRLDNRVGYVVDNSIPCCWICNKMKGTLTGPEFYTQVHKIYKHSTTL